MILDLDFEDIQIESPCKLIAKFSFKLFEL